MRAQEPTNPGRHLESMEEGVSFCSGVWLVDWSKMIQDTFGNKLYTPWLAIEFQAGKKPMYHFTGETKVQ